MDSKSLRFFLVIAEEENMSKAAERLHMSQPPLSRQLRLLEEEVGTELFERGHGRHIHDPGGSDDRNVER